MPCKPEQPFLGRHGAVCLPAVTVDSYNIGLKDKGGLLGDRASGRAFRDHLDEIRQALRAAGDTDPLGDRPSGEIAKRKLDKVLVSGAPEAAGVVQGAVEGFASALAHVIRRFLATSAWRGVERIVVGGGLRESRVGELAVGRAAVLLKSDRIEVDLDVIRHHPDEAGLIGCAHLLPQQILADDDSLVAVDVGGSNIRCGIVDLNLRKAPDLSRAKVRSAGLWRHADEAPDRDDAVERLVGMLKDLIRKAGKDGCRLAPVIAVGCPGHIEADGTIARGGQNLPGDWEGRSFNLPRRLREAIPEIAGHPAGVVMHNDAVVQGLSQSPFMRDTARWGVLTIGTGLGNACFTNRPRAVGD